MNIQEFEAYCKKPHSDIEKRCNVYEHYLPMVFDRIKTLTAALDKANKALESANLSLLLRETENSEMISPKAFWELKSPYWVFHEKEGYIHVLATDPKDAIEQYYKSLESMLHPVACRMSELLLRPKRVKDAHGNSWDVDLNTGEIRESPPR